MDSTPFTIALDGPAAAGKGTISKALATYFGFAHLDTGLLYRAVGRAVLNGVAPLAAAQNLDAGDFDVANLRTAEVAQAASKVAVMPDVRAALVDFQRAFARRIGGAVLDGRDIGTVICPNAEAKIFVTASPEIRAMRRFEELRGNGAETDFDTVLADVVARDARDAERQNAPMIQADDAILLDTSNLTIDQAVSKAISFVESRGGTKPV